MKAALKFIETLKVPKNLNEAGTQIWQGSFVIDRLRAALAQPVAEIKADMSERPMADAEILSKIACTPKEQQHYLKFARAIEAHHKIGEKK